MRTYSRKSRPDRAFDQLGEYPMRRCRVVLEARPGFPVAPPRAEAPEPSRAVVPLRREEWRVGKSGRVQHHLFDGDDLFAVGPELGDVFGDALVDVDRALADEDPHRARDDGLRRREDHVARVGRGRSERHRRGDTAVARERDLTRRHDAGVDIGLRPLDERGEGIGVDSEFGGIGGRCRIERRHGRSVTSRVGR